ncbi:hypothetical protein [Flavobacterium sp. GT3R68]|uniref:hypothetical protein n=1 Tax=Flavobacterium sp. GT3R68 TaxID=2594437 RepID=UPI000F86C1E2|nr:hypothetical protein [Flavobacterium sp. GT3R68]RTY92479.1 hypothetical protein EKL32_16885 [Flavobacterium sp. GSN2]TRW94105.1 hypothetical protein FNW07_04100 [Flavobacterium sp. GT3R68]
MKKLLLLFFVLSMNSALAQDQKLLAIPLSDQLINADSFLGFDALGAYYLTKDNVISKHFDGKISEYKNVSLGKITKVDLQNPLKIVLFYEDFNSAVILDNQLNEVHKINFSENEIPIMAAALGIASQNRLWIYNSLSQQIGLFDYQKNTYQSIALSFQANFKYYETDFNTFQWIDEKLNWYSCDVFGKVTSLGKVADFDQIQSVTNKGILFYKDGKLFLHDLQKNVIYTIVNIEKTFKNFYYKDQILSIFTTTGIINYKITIP